MSENFERYQRQLLLKGFGETGQQKLQDAKVLVIGAGGLGCPALQYLTAAGVGTIGIVDDDIVSLDNLHRQILYTTNDIGSAKVVMAAFALEQLNFDIDIIPYNTRLTNQNAIEIITPYDIVIDGTDNFATRYLVNDACVVLNKVLVYGAISQFEGQVAIFNYGTNATNYRDLFPTPDNTILNCEELGVLGVLPGIIGSMMANETIKLITGIGQPLVNTLLTFNALTNQSHQFTISPREETAKFIPANEQAFSEMNYELFCSANNSFDIDANRFDELLNDTNVAIVDVREVGELPLLDFKNVPVPLSQLTQSVYKLNKDTIVLVCQTGKRSTQAAQILLNHFGTTKKIHSLQGGIVNWKKQHAENVG
ncbi:MAG TPA: HesA/MoeB/ThiF family protein [Ferruginibacter sp.]|jgi:molybdopterin/thiamine biosynthesis adenylyltransferase/rhodanese-related sulfurtransferase|nr:HesA/MoeB/ThiF family protein [Ferruginibacter sp.]